jgi:hypothetical protein
LLAGDVTYIVCQLAHDFAEDIRREAFAYTWGPKTWKIRAPDS